jgi:hypothetical protein
VSFYAMEAASDDPMRTAISSDAAKLPSYADMLASSHRNAKPTQHNSH